MVLSLYHRPVKETDRGEGCVCVCGWGGGGGGTGGREGQGNRGPTVRMVCYVCIRTLG